MSQPPTGKIPTEESSPTWPAAERGSPPPRPVSARRIQKVSEVIAREIVRDSRGLPPGTKLPPEAKLLEKYHVGRASLREALRLLEVQGLVVIRPGPGGGPMIAEADSTHFGRMASLYFHRAGATYRDALDARLILEPVVAGMIAQEQRPEHLETLQRFLDRPDETPEDTSPARSEVLSEREERALEFHIMLMGMSGNPVISLLVQSLQHLHTDLQGMGLRPENDFLHVHDMIARAIIDGRPGQAEQLMREHMLEFIQYQLEHSPARLELTVSWD